MENRQKRDVSGDGGSSFNIIGKNAISQTYRIAVCDDSDEERNRTASMCEEILSAHGIEHEISLFEDTEALEGALNENAEAFALLILDINMGDSGKISGMEFAKRLRERRIGAQLLFITSYGEYALEGYDVHPLHFLMKPVDTEALERVLCGEWERTQRVKTVALRAGDSTILLNPDEIRYAESQNHTVHIYTEEKSYRLSMPLAELQTCVPNGVLCRCHNSFLVNLRWVSEVTRLSVILRDGTALPMGRRYYGDFRSAMVRFMNRDFREA